MVQCCGYGNVMCYLFIGDFFSVEEVFCIGLVQEVMQGDFFECVLVIVIIIIKQVLLVV